MKKQLLLWAVIFSYFTTSAQKSYLFKIKLLPQHSYQTTSESKIMGSNRDSIPPMISFGNSLTIETGAMGPAKTFPVKFREQAAGVLYKGQPGYFEPGILNKETISAHVDVDGKIMIDSIPRAIDPDALTETATDEINEYKDIQFPAHPLKIGDSFSNEKQVNVPFADAKITMKVVYKLTAIKNKLAVFTLKDTTTFDRGTEKTADKLQGTVTGTGELVFDLLSSYPQSLIDRLDFDYNMYYRGKDTPGHMIHQQHLWIDSQISKVKPGCAE